MDTLRVIMEYEYRCGSNAAQAARNINDVYGANTTNECTTCYWFARFRSGNLDMKNERRGRPKTLVDNDELKAIVEADDTQFMAELAADFDVSIKTILVHLRQIDKVKKLAKWVPHELNDCQREVRVETCIAQQTHK
ncbi:histone-lysine N-methyltransferase SETMAR-like [Leptidea sinapis]|uniref:histone-lysine N-methyltransferase SETMAR-like n=1 Tax=Leptidea sinapis TaxID=189913 RepID=UPI0021C31B67|nr:histone-lysine N-methyltransferase SETMAR-like [Leptidea sinapis]